MRQAFRGVAADGSLAAFPCVGRAARWLTTLCIVVGSAGCILTQDLPDPALDIPQEYKPQGYKAARLTGADASPTLDWWRGFRSRELTDLMEEAQTVNLDIAAATSRFIQADAQARIAGAALLPPFSPSNAFVFRVLPAGPTSFCRRWAEPGPFGSAHLYGCAVPAPASPCDGADHDSNLDPSAS